MHIHTLMAFILYFIILSFIAFMSQLKTMKAKDSSGFMLGGRSINFWLTAISAHASDMSDWLFMVFPAMIYSGGMPAFWVAIGLITYMFLNWHFIAPKIRVETEKYKATTLSSYFEKRFADRSGSIRVVGAIISLVFFTVYIAAGLKGIGYIFESAFGFNYMIGVLIAVAIVILYTTIGGFIAVAWTDFFQGMFLLAMILLVPIVAYFKIDGFSAIQLSILNKGLSLSLLPDYSISTIASSLMLAFGWGVGYFGMPHIITKFMAIDDASKIYKSKYLGIVWQTLSLSGAALVGFVGMAFFKDGLVHTELIFIEMVQALFSPFFGGFILCAILAATISTIDSQVLVLASTIAEDLYKKIFRSRASEKELKWVYRLGIFAICTISAIIAFDRSQSIESYVWFAWRGIGSSFGPLVLMALYSNNVSRNGALAGMLVGCITALTFPLFSIYDPMLPGFFLSLFSIWSISKFI